MWLCPPLRKYIIEPPGANLDAEAWLSFIILHNDIASVQICGRASSQRLFGRSVHRDSQLIEDSVVQA